MIALERIRTASAVPARFRGADKKAKDRELLLARRAYLIDNTKKVEFNSSYWKTAKTQLKKESHGKCAYCEANTDVVAHGDVEHYRPKSRYWWLAYTYDNYLYACQICNQTYKSNNFTIGAHEFPAPLITAQTTNLEIDQLVGHISPDPLDLIHTPNLSRYLSEHRTEQAYLLNPYVDDPAVYYAYEADDTLEEVKIIATQPDYASYVEAADDFYGINRIELKNIRYQVFKTFRVLKKTYHKFLEEGTDEPLRKEIGQQLDLMLSSKYLFAGMNRYFDNKL